MSDEHPEDENLEVSTAHQAETADPGDGEPSVPSAAPVIPPETPPDGLEQTGPTGAPAEGLPTEAGRPFDFGFIRDIPVHISVELGRSKLAIKDVLALGKGSAVVLTNLEGEALDIRANNRLIAKGEVLVENDKYGIRIKEIITSRERLDQLMR